MGQMINGQWIKTDQLTDHKGEFQRTLSAFQGRLTETSSPLDSYLLIGSKACPWAHRVILAVKLQGFNELEIHYAPPELGEEGWCTPESLRGPLKSTWIHELYQRSHPRYTGRVTLPLLWDREHNRIISNDSGELLTHFVYTLRRKSVPIEPHHSANLIQEVDSTLIEEMHTWQYWITSHINNGPYRAIFAEHQSTYESNILRFFSALDVVEDRLNTREFFMGDQLTLCDLMLFPTLYRMEIAYQKYLKCTFKSLSDYPALLRYTERLKEHPIFAETLSPEEIDIHYGRSVPKKDHHELIYRG